MATVIGRDAGNPVFDLFDDANTNIHKKRASHFIKSMFVLF